VGVLYGRSKTYNVTCEGDYCGAWSDGELDNTEINSLKDCLFQLPDLSATDWKLLDMYIESPPADSEKEALIADLQKNITSKADKELVLSEVKQVIEADGIVTAEEQKFFEEIETAMDGASTSVFKLFAGLLRGGNTIAIEGTREEH